MKKITSLLFIMVIILSCDKNSNPNTPLNNGVNKEITSINNQYKELLQKFNPSIHKNPITSEELNSIESFDNLVFEFIKKYSNSNLKTRSTNEFYIEDYVDNIDKLLLELKKNGATEEFCSILNKTFTSTPYKPFTEDEILNNHALKNDEKLTILLITSLFSQNLDTHSKGVETRGRTCAEQMSVDKRRCNRDAGIGIVGFVLLAPFTGGIGTAVGVSSTIVYHVACIKDAESDYLDCIN